VRPCRMAHAVIEPSSPNTRLLLEDQAASTYERDASTDDSAQTLRHRRSGLAPHRHCCGVRHQRQSIPEHQRFGGASDFADYASKPSDGSPARAACASQDDVGRACIHSQHRSARPNGALIASSREASRSGVDPRRDDIARIGSRWVARRS